MLIFCLVVFSATALTLLAALAEAVHRVTCPPAWAAFSHGARAVASADAERRTQPLSFVGADRRHQSVQTVLDLAEARRAA
jgi:hypothetical protein